VSWHAKLALHYRRDGSRTTAHDRHEGPLRVLQRLYPEGEGICHHVIVHPPGGIVGGDVLAVEATLEAGCHAVVTTPGATRFYRSEGAWAQQHTALKLAGDARFEWLPLETIVHRGARADNRVTVELAPQAEAMGWDVLALGLPAAGEAFDAGTFRQHVELLPLRWLERGVVDGGDTLLLDGALGFAGRRVLATAWFASGQPLAGARRDALLEAAREALGDEPDAGATSPAPPVVVVRMLARRVEPAMHALQRVRAAWRRAAWNLAPNPPRVWRT
jgi:urease accessory protein